MPFQPTRSAINPVQLALSIREMRMKQQQAERQFQLDKIAAIGEAKARQIDTATKEYDLLSKQDDARKRLAADQVTVDGEIDRFKTERAPTNVFVEGGGVGDGFVPSAPGQAPKDLASIVGELDPKVVQADRADIQWLNSQQNVIDSQIAQLAQTLAPITGESPQAVFERLSASVGVTAKTEARLGQEKLKSELSQRRSEKQQDFIFSQKEKIADENRRREAEERAREQGHWDRGDLIQEKVRLEKKFDAASKTNEDWNALKKLETENKAINYLEIVQRWVRNVDEGATVREGDIDLVRAFGMSGMEEFKAWLAGTADAEKKISPVSKESIKTAFEQLLEERDRSWADAWGSANDYADAVGWEKRDRATALPQSRAMRRVLERHDKRSLRGVLVPDAFRTDSNFAEANKRAAQRLHIPGSRVSPKEAMSELKRMYQDAVRRKQ